MIPIYYITRLLQIVYGSHKMRPTFVLRMIYLDSCLSPLKYTLASFSAISCRVLGIQGMRVMLGGSFSLIVTTIIIFHLLCLFHLKASTVSLSARLRRSLLSRFSQSTQPSGIDRVVACWDNFSRGETLERYLDEQRNVQQSALCFVEGLSAMCYHDLPTLHPWALQLESHYKDILKEVDEFQQLSTAGGEVWLPARDQVGSAYGPEWRTLGLQDRSVWDLDNAKHFPTTIKILNDLKVPSCEVFFARQAPHSGIKPHSDKNNFIITCHLGLSIPQPEGQCWITVGDQKYSWQTGRAVVFDTSIIHSTENISSEDRLVLLIRLWHPELTSVEIDAFKFIFAYLDHANAGDDVLAEFERRAALSPLSSPLPQLVHAMQLHERDRGGDEGVVSADRKSIMMGKDQHKGLQQRRGSENSSGSADTTRISQKGQSRGDDLNELRTTKKGTKSTGKGFGSVAAKK